MTDELREQMEQLTKLVGIVYLTTGHEPEDGRDAGYVAEMYAAYVEENRPELEGALRRAVAWDLSPLPHASWEATVDAHSQRYPDLPEDLG